MARVECNVSKKVARLSSGKIEPPMFELSIRYEKDGSKRTVMKLFGEEF